MNSSIYEQDDADWLQSVIRHVPPQDVAALSAVLEGDEARPQASAARLLSFYIGRALKAAQEPDPLVSQPARVQLEAIREGLARVDMQPPAAVARPPVPPAAFSPAPMDVEAVSGAIRSVYRLTVRRNAVDEEVGIWLGNLGNGLPFYEFLTLMEGGDEARAKRAAEAIGGDLSDGEFVLALFGIVAGRGCNGYELDAVRSRLEAGGITRIQLLAEFFMQALEAERSRQDEAVHDGLSCSIMGTSQFLTLAEWQQKARDTEELAQARAALRPTAPFRFWAASPFSPSAKTR